MKVRTIIIMALAMAMSGGIAAAQMQGGTSGENITGGLGMMYGQHMGPGMMRNLEMMSAMLTDMHGLMNRGHMTVEQQQRMFEIMRRMGSLLQKMGTPIEGRVVGEHYKQLQELEIELDKLKNQVK
jgi:hypothetical protein